MNAVVLTSENSEAFYAEKLGLPPPEPTVADDAPAKTEPAVESGAEDDKGGTSEPGTDEQQNTSPDPQAKHKLNLRFSELTKQRDEAKAAAEARAAELAAEREARGLAEKRAKELEARLNPPKPADEVGPEPKSEDYTDAFQYAKDLAEWSTNKALKDRDLKEAEKHAQAEQAKIAETFRARATELRKEVPDYDAILTASPVMVSNEVRDAILDSDEGPRLLLHLAQNPDVAQKIAQMPEKRALREIGKLEVIVAKAAKASTDKGAEVTKPAAAAAEISRAPAPISPLRGSQSIPDLPMSANGEFTGTYAQWKEMRKAGKIK